MTAASSQSMPVGMSHPAAGSKWVPQQHNIQISTLLDQWAVHDGEANLQKTKEGLPLQCSEMTP